MRQEPVQRNRQRGFVLIIVVMLVLLLVGLCGLLISSTQTDLRIAANDREASVAFYAAEAGIANGKDWLWGKSGGTGSGAWNAVLRSGSNQLCDDNDDNPYAPGTKPDESPIVNYDPAHGAQYQFCIHNNAIDPNFIPPSVVGGTTDGDGIVTIESYGFGPDGAKSHLTADVLASITPLVGADQAQGGGGPLKQGSSDTAPTAAGMSAGGTF